MPGTVKKSKSNEKDINHQLYNTIYTKVTKRKHNYDKPQKGDKTLEKCIDLFKQGADPNVLSTLEKLLREETKLAKPQEQKEEYQKHYKYYIKNFLPALKGGVIGSEELAKPPVPHNERKQSQRPKTKRGKIVQTILEITNRSSSVSSIPNAVEENIEGQMQLKRIEEQNNTQETPLNLAEKKSGDNKILSNSDVTEKVFEKYSKVVEEIEEKRTSKFSSDSESNSKMGLRELSATRTLSEESLNSILSSTEEDNGLQPEDEGETKLAHLTKTRSKWPSRQRFPSKYRKKIKDQMQPEQVLKEELKLNSEKSGSTLPGKEKLKLEEQKKEAVLSEQSAPDGNNNEVLSKKQPNNRNFRIALATGCALSAIGCLIAGVVTLGMVEVVLFAMSVVLAISAAVTRYSIPPSSELASTNLSRPIDDKELTACSHL